MASYKPITIDFVPPCFSKEQFNNMFEDYIAVTNQLIEMEDKIKNLEFEGFAGLYNYYILHSLFVSQFTKDRVDPTAHESFKTLISFFGGYDKMISKIKDLKDTKWIILSINGNSPQLILMADSYQGIFYSIPILAIDMEEHIWAMDYNSIDTYLSQVLGYFKWDKFDERINKIKMNKEFSEFIEFYQ